MISSDSGCLVSSDSRARCKAGLLIVTVVALCLRVLCLGTTFESSDNSLLVLRVLTQHGFLWMLKERYGLLISLLVKIPSHIFAWMGIGMTEFWWKLPVALLGTAQIPLVYGFLRKLNCSPPASLVGAAFIAVFPLHVMQSRYLWGYEATATFCVTMALWSMICFLENPSSKGAAIASLLCGLYLISHGYIMPFPACLLATVILYGKSEKAGIFARLRANIALLIRRPIWGFPLLVLPFCYTPLKYASTKKTHLGFYALDYTPSFFYNLGLFLFVLVLLSTVALFFSAKFRGKPGILLAICGVLYLAPLAFGTPPGTTSTRGYMLVGTYFLILSSVFALDALFKMSKAAFCCVALICITGTLWGSAETIFGRDEHFDPAFVKGDRLRATVSLDPGAKAAAMLVRKYVKLDQTVLALHRNIEGACYRYYFGRDDYAFNDLSLGRSIYHLRRNLEKADVIICDREQAPFVSAAQEKRGNQNLYTAIVSPAGAIGGINRQAYPIRPLKTGNSLYSDRNYKLLDPLPGFLKNAEYIEGRNADKTSTTPAFLNFQSDRPVMVYIAWPANDKAIPEWLKDWQKRNERLKVSGSCRYRVLYSKKFPAGKITLGGNNNPKGVGGPLFPLKTVVFAENKPMAWVFARNGVDIPVNRIDVEKWNLLFDRTYGPRFSQLLRNRERYQQSRAVPVPAD